MTVRLTFTFTAPPQIIKHQISDVGDPCSRAHTSRSPWRGCFIPCLVIPRGGGVLARLHCCAAQGSRSQRWVHCLCTWLATAILNWVPCAGFCTQSANLRCWHCRFQPSMPVWSARFKASAYDSQWVSDIQLSIKGGKKKKLDFILLLTFCFYSQGIVNRLCWWQELWKIIRIFYFFKINWVY